MAPRLRFAFVGGKDSASAASRAVDVLTNAKPKTGTRSAPSTARRSRACPIEDGEGGGAAFTAHPSRASTPGTQSGFRSADDGPNLPLAHKTRTNIQNVREKPRLEAGRDWERLGRTQTGPSPKVPRGATSGRSWTLVWNAHALYSRGRRGGHVLELIAGGNDPPARTRRMRRLPGDRARCSRSRRPNVAGCQSPDVGATVAWLEED